MEQLGVFLVLIFVIVINLVIAQDLNPYHFIIKGFVRKNFKCVQEHRYDVVLIGVSDKQLEHTFAGDNCLSDTRRDKVTLKRWLERVGTVLQDV